MSIKLRLAPYFGTSTDFWMNIEKDFENFRLTPQTSRTARDSKRTHRP